MTIASPRKASRYFKAKMEFTTGPIEVSQAIQDNEEMTIVDVRAPEDFEKGHIPGAFNLPRDSWTSFSGLSRDKPNIIYCYSEDCHIAAAAAQQFAEQGLPVMELQGGFEQWMHNNLPVET